jgi:hypothetical protein
MKLVKLTKLGRLDKPHSYFEHLEKGEERIGLMLKKPEIGRRFILLPDVGNGSLSGGISTSDVQKIVSEHIFETFNTIYRWEVLTDKKEEKYG